MLTRAAPAITRALTGVLPDGQAASLLSSLGQCQQPLQHRGAVSFARGAFGNSGGVANSQGWNPADYPGLFPDAVQRGGDVEAPSPGGYQAGDWYSNYYGGPYFDLTTQLQQTMNQYIAQNTYEGNTVTIQGPTFITEVTSEKVVAREIETEQFNGEQLEDAPAGPQGDRGRDGAPGAPGLPGQPGGVFVFNAPLPPPGFNQALLLAQLALNLAIDNRRQIDRLKQALRQARIRIRPHRAVQGVKFDADACDVVVDRSPALSARLVIAVP